MKRIFCITTLLLECYCANDNTINECDNNDALYIIKAKYHVIVLLALFRKKAIFNILLYIIYILLYIILLYKLTLILTFCITDNIDVILMIDYHC